MRLIPPEFQKEAMTTCLCWRLTRVDGEELGLTDHDKAVEFDGLAYSPGASFASGSFGATRDLRPSRADAGGALSSEAITEDDLQAGVWDTARVDVFRVDWQNPHARIRIWSGHLSEVTHGETSFTVELVSLKAQLERPVGRVYSRHCDAVLGDERCGADANGRTCDQRFETCRDLSLIHI